METDEELYSRARRGDVAAFDGLYARYERRLFGFALRFLGDRRDAEEVFHDAFLTVLRSRDLRFDQARFAAWLFRVARNLCANRLRSRRRGRHALDLVSAPSELGAPSPEELIEHEERVLSLKAAVDHLQPALAEVFRLRQSGLSYLEVAAVLGLPLGTVKSRMNTLVKQLQAKVEAGEPVGPERADAARGPRDDMH